MDDSIAVSAPPETAVRTRSVSVTILAVLAVFYTLYVAKSILQPLVLALVLNLLLMPAMRFLHHRLRVPRALAALALILLLFSVIGGIGFAISLPASGWVAKAPQAYQVLQQKFAPMAEVVGRVRDGMKSVEHLLQQSEQTADEGQQQVVAVQQPSGMGGAAMGVGGAILSNTTDFLGGLFTVLILLFFLLSAGDSLLRRLVEVLPRFADKRRAVSMANEIEENVAAYLATISLMNLLVGVANGLSIWALGLPDPLLFGTLAFLLNYIPIIGPLCGMVIFFFVGLFTAPSVWIAALASAIYLGIHILEGETVTPMLLARRFTLNPVLVIISLLFWHWLWGITGAFLSVPLLAVFKIVCDHVDGLSSLGHMLGAEPSHRNSHS